MLLDLLPLALPDLKIGSNDGGSMGVQLRLLPFFNSRNVRKAAGKSVRD